MSRPGGGTVGEIRDTLMYITNVVIFQFRGVGSELKEHCSSTDHYKGYLDIHGMLDETNNNSIIGSAEYLNAADLARKKDFAQLITRVYDTTEYNSAKRGYPECYHEFVEKILKAKAKNLSKLSKLSQDMMNLKPFGQSSNDTSSTHFSNNNTIDENVVSKNSSSSGYSKGC